MVAGPVVFPAEWSVFAGQHAGYPRTVDPRLNQIAAHGFGALFAQNEVIVLGAVSVAVSLLSRTVGFASATRRGRLRFADLLQSVSTVSRFC